MTSFRRRHISTTRVNHVRPAPIEISPCFRRLSLQTLFHSIFLVDISIWRHSYSKSSCVWQLVGGATSRWPGSIMSGPPRLRLLLSAQISPCFRRQSVQTLFAFNFPAGHSHGKVFILTASHMRRRYLKLSRRSGRKWMKMQKGVKFDRDFHVLHSCANDLFCQPHSKRMNEWIPNYKTKSYVKHIRMPEFSLSIVFNHILAKQHYPPSLPTHIRLWGIITQTIFWQTPCTAISVIMQQPNFYRK